MNEKLIIKFNTFSNILILSILIFGGFIWADNNGVWTLASDIRPGIFGSDEAPGNYTFNDSVLLEKNSYYKGEELNQKYVNSNGDTITGNLTVSGNLKVDSATTRDDSSNSVITKEGLKNLFYEKTINWGPNNIYGVQEKTLFCEDSEDIVLGCFWQPNPAGNSSLGIISYYVTGSPSNWYAFGAEKFIGENSGCNFKVANYPYNRISWTTFDLTIQCLDVN